MKKNKNTSLIIFLFCIIFLFIYYNLWYNKISTEFDMENFLSKEYTNEDIMNFCDIGFFYGRIKKWEKDINVEIVDIEKLSDWNITEIDSIIKILSPLIEPIKIRRLKTGGNIKIYRAIEDLPKMLKNEIPNAHGIALVNPLDFSHLKISTNIIRVNIYVPKYFGTYVLMHEFLHAIGLDHASKPHKHPMIMASQKAPNCFTIEEYDKFSDNPFLISEQEKKVIKMLYSSGVKSGLKRSEFIKKMKLHY